jgi:hypothetical protein
MRVNFCNLMEVLWVECKRRTFLMTVANIVAEIRSRQLPNTPRFVFRLVINQFLPWCILVCRYSELENMEINFLIACSPLRSWLINWLLGYLSQNFAKYSCHSTSLIFLFCHIAGSVNHVCNLSARHNYHSSFVS